MKKIYLFVFLLLVCSGVSAHEEIVVRQDSNNNDVAFPPSRSILPEITASIDGSTITLSFPLPATSYYSVAEQQSGVVVLSGMSDESTGTSFELPVGTANGFYVLNIYAYGCWWIGVFAF